MVRDDIVTDGEDLPLVVADAHEATSLRALCERTTAVHSLVGPYQLHGTSMIKACTATGTHYTDLCGEPVWMREMIDRNESVARDSGARIVFSVGFDSLPMELGVQLLQDVAHERLRARMAHVDCRIAFTDVGGFSRGTAVTLLASADAARKDAAVAARYPRTPTY